MIEQFIFYLAMVMIILLAIMLANKLKIAYPILLVLAGLGVSFVPFAQGIKVDPELIFLIFLPPLLYEASFAVSWKELWKMRRIISSFAFVVVFLTAISVALVANRYIPGISLALGFVLGGIVSPPDAVSAGAILKFVKIPKNLATLLEGESLFNDASSLIIFRFAMIAVATGQFVWQEAALSFGWMVIGGIGIGLLVGLIFLKIHKVLPVDEIIATLLTFVAPYTMYIAAEEVHASGVMSVVAGGLFLSRRSHEVLRTSGARLRGFNVWQSLVFLINGIVFLLIGLDLPEIMSGMRNEGISISQAAGYGVLITGVLIFVRILSSYGAVVFTLLIRNWVDVPERNPGWKAPVLLGWTGMRGVVSLAAALSIPLTLEGGEPFPQRDLILFITFVVILLTLIVQGLTLPALIKFLGVSSGRGDFLEEEVAENYLRKGMRQAAFSYLKENYGELKKENEFFRNLMNRMEEEDKDEIGPEFPEERLKIYLETLEEQRTWLRSENRSNPRIDEELVRKYLTKLDLEEERLKMG